MTVGHSTTSEAVVLGIGSLRGWDSALLRAQRVGGLHGARIGRFLSALLLAGGEGRGAVAISGTLDDDGTGDLAIVYPDVIVLGVAEALTGAGGEETVTLHSLEEIERVQVSAERSFYDSEGADAAHTGIRVTLTISGRTFTFPGSTTFPTTLVDEGAAHRVLDVIRTQKAGVTTT